MVEECLSEEEVNNYFINKDYEKPDKKESKGTCLTSRNNINNKREINKKVLEDAKESKNLSHKKKYRRRYII